MVTTRLSVFMSGTDVSLTDKGRAGAPPRRAGASAPGCRGVQQPDRYRRRVGRADGLQDFSAGDLEAASLHDERRFAVAIGEIADVHRGETVLVFSHGGAMSPAIPRLSVNVGNNLAGQGFLPNCAVAEVEVDADGWRLVSWPGASEQA